MCFFTLFSPKSFGQTLCSKSLAHPVLHYKSTVVAINRRAEGDSSINIPRSINCYLLYFDAKVHSAETLLQMDSFFQCTFQNEVTLKEFFHWQQTNNRDLANQSMS